MFIPGEGGAGACPWCGVGSLVGGFCSNCGHDERDDDDGLEDDDVCPDCGEDFGECECEDDDGNGEDDDGEEDNDDEIG